MSLLRLGDPGLADADILLAGEIVVRGDAKPNESNSSSNAPIPFVSWGVAKVSTENPQPTR